MTHRLLRGRSMATATPGRARRALLRRATLLALLMLPLAACSDLSDNLLEATDPDLINPGDLNSPDGAAAIRNGALDRFRNMTAGAEGMWLWGGLLTDEWSTSSTFQQNDEVDQRQAQANNSQTVGFYRNVNRVRTAANQAIAALTVYFPGNKADIAEMYFARGFAELQLASDYCNGIPLSDAASGEVIFGQPLTVAEVFDVARASFDSALTLIQGETGSAAIRVQRAASIGKARALLGNAQFSAAAAAVGGIPSTFSYDHTFAVSSGDNSIWTQGSSTRRYAVGDNLEGNNRTFPVANALPFFSANDPRVPAAYVLSGGNRVLSQDGQTFAKVTPLWARSTAVSVAHGVDARMVEAEAALRAGQVTTWLQILNALRAAPPKLGEVQPAPLPALTDPGAEAARVDLQVREKAFWTFGRGQRLGDLRRHVRQYGRTPANTFPTGNHYKGGVYGDATNFPIPQDELNNPNFTGCLNRNP